MRAGARHARAPTGRGDARNVAPCATATRYMRRNCMPSMHTRAEAGAGAHVSVRTRQRSHVPTCRDAGTPCSPRAQAGIRARHPQSPALARAARCATLERAVWRSAAQCGAATSAGQRGEVAWRRGWRGVVPPHQRRARRRGVQPTLHCAKDFQKRTHELMPPCAPVPDDMLCACVGGQLPAPRAGSSHKFGKRGGEGARCGDCLLLLV